MPRIKQHGEVLGPVFMDRRTDNVAHLLIIGRGRNRAADWIDNLDFDLCVMAQQGTAPAAAPESKIFS